MRQVIRTLALSLPVAMLVPCPADAGDDGVCIALLEDERTRLADHELEVQLAQSRLAAFEKIHDLVEGLWKGDAIERMTWLEARHDRDAARLELERARLILERLQSHVEQLRLACGNSTPERPRGIADAHRRYLQANCDQQAKAIEVAKVNLEFNREWLASIRELRKGSIGTATAQDVILAELNVKLEEQRLADAKGRTEACRKKTMAP